MNKYKKQKCKCSPLDNEKATACIYFCKPPFQYGRIQCMCDGFSKNSDKHSLCMTISPLSAPGFKTLPIISNAMQNKCTKEGVNSSVSNIKILTHCKKTSTKSGRKMYVCYPVPDYKNRKKSGIATSSHTKNIWDQDKEEKRISSTHSPEMINLTSTRAYESSPAIQSSHQILNAPSALSNPTTIISGHAFKIILLGLFIIGCIFLIAYHQIRKRAFSLFCSSPNPNQVDKRNGRNCEPFVTFTENKDGVDN